MTAEQRKKAAHIFPIAIKVALVIFIGSALYIYGIKGNLPQKSNSGLAEGPFAGELAPDFTLPDLNGKLVRLSDYRGKVVFLNFFATWCDPCRSELPDFNRMDLRFKNSNLDAVFLLVNVRQQPAEVQAFMIENGYSLTTVTDVSGAVASKYLVSGIPATFIVGRDGKIITKRVGAISASLLETLVEQTVR